MYYVLNFIYYILYTFMLVYIHAYCIFSKNIISQSRSKTRPNKDDRAPLSARMGSRSGCEEDVMPRRKVRNY